MSYLATPILSVWLKGDRYTDPIDGKSFKRFLPYGYEEQRPNVLSPSTLSLERHRLLWLYLKNETDFFQKPLRVLHMAPEQCFLSIFKKMKHLDYTTADLYSPIVDVKADILDLPFKDGEFDLVFCNHVLEHIADDNKAMKELYRVMKSGGMGIFQVPQELSRETTYEDPDIITPEDKAKHFGQYDHVRIYGRDYFERLRNVGFNVEEVDYSLQLSPELSEKYCLAKGEILPVCFKP
jgi:SAM-dependent methyltransferase